MSDEKNSVDLATPATVPAPPVYSLGSYPRQAIYQPSQELERPFAGVNLNGSSKPFIMLSLLLAGSVTLAAKSSVLAGFMAANVSFLSGTAGGLTSLFFDRSYSSRYIRCFVSYRIVAVLVSCINEAKKASTSSSFNQLSIQ